MAAWDAWVDERVTARAQAEAAMMKASGLTEPIPGLADMQGQGEFFECAPYGTCWEPTAADEEDQSDSATRETQSDVTPSAKWPEPAAIAQSPGAAAAPASSSIVAQQQAPGAATANTAHPTDLFDRSVMFQCSPDYLDTVVERDRVTGEEHVISRRLMHRDQILGTERPWWAVCHAGSWIPRGHRYVWVVGHRRHHHPPIHWVKQGRNIAFVPRHPLDVRGKSPLNLNEVRRRRPSR